MKKSKLRKARTNTSLFKPGDAKSLDQFLIASMIQGGFTAIGAVLGTVLAKYILKEIDQKLPMPESFHAVVSKEAA